MKKSHVCRCCLKKGCFKIKKLDDELENYGEMIVKTFNLKLNISQKFICEDCVAKLHDAASFRQQILDVNIITLHKLSAENTELHKIYDDGDRSSCEGWQLDLKMKGGTSVKLEPETDSYVAEEGSNLTKYHENRLKDVTTTDLNKQITNKMPGKTKELKSPTKRLKKKSTNKNEVLEHQLENSIKLITNSNICLFKSLRTRFACYVCDEKHFEMKELRVHSKIHSTDDFKRRIKRLRGKSYENADITDLSCNICSENCDNLDILRNHLNKNHNIVFGDTNLLIPYKLEEGFHCQICKESYNTFTRLSIHMNVHATSNVCEICGMAFYNRLSLRNHIRATHEEKKCSLCSLNFPSSTKLVDHRRKVHKTASVKHYCLKCDMTFRYFYLLKKHMIETHNGKVTLVECRSCGKVFKDQNGLKTHFRSVHLNVRKYCCSLCELRFSTRSGKLRHETTHSSGVLFACNVCEAKVRSKDSLRRHLKKQHGGAML